MLAFTAVEDHFVALLNSGRKTAVCQKDESYRHPASTWTGFGTADKPKKKKSADQLGEKNKVCKFYQGVPKSNLNFLECGLVICFYFYKNNDDSKCYLFKGYKFEIYF